MCVLADNSGSIEEGSSGFPYDLPHRKHLTLPELRSQSDLDRPAPRPGARGLASLFHYLRVGVVTVLGRTHLHGQLAAQPATVGE